MKSSYDQEVHILWIRLNARKIVESGELEPGMLVDYDAEGRIIGIEIHDASLCTDDPRQVELNLAA